MNGPRIHTEENSQILTVSKKIVIETYGRQKKVRKVSFFFTRRICALASLEWQIFLLVKKSITLLTCYINNNLGVEKMKK
jgi:hypothetical protein